jgi:hypothetical protein
MAPLKLAAQFNAQLPAASENNYFAVHSLCSITD